MLSSNPVGQVECTENPFWRTLWLAAVAFCWLALCGWEALAQSKDMAEAAQSKLLAQLTTEGMAITASQKEKLPMPLLLPGQTAAARRQTLEKLSGASGWERFSRNSAVAPLLIDIDYIKDSAGERIGHRIHVAFVAHTQLAKLRDRDFLRQTFGQPDEQQRADGFRFEELKAEELEELGVAADTENNEGYAFIEADLLDRVKIRGVIRFETVEQKNSLVVAWYMDARFADVAKRGNSWSKLDAVDNGKVTEQAVHPYSGCGGYLSLTQLDAASNIVLIESWTLLHEPTDWFQGSNLLRSKLPLTIQESVRKFRRKLAEK